MASYYATLGDAAPDYARRAAADVTNSYTTRVGGGIAADFSRRGPANSTSYRVTDRLSERASAIPENNFGAIDAHRYPLASTYVTRAELAPDAPRRVPSAGSFE
jgi:hypothetical protein